MGVTYQAADVLSLLKTGRSDRKTLEEETPAVAMLDQGKIRNDISKHHSDEGDSNNQ